MFSRPHHQRILKLLSALDADFLRESECYFGGGTAIVLLLQEYRESRDVDFLCSSVEGYRAIRNAVFDQGLQGIFKEDIKSLRDVRSDQYGVRSVLGVDDEAISFEIVREGRIQLTGEAQSPLPVVTLSMVDLWAEKLLANADRFNDEAVLSRDLIDLAMMIEHWGQIPAAVWNKAKSAYGESSVQAFAKGIEFLQRPKYFAHCCDKLNLDEACKPLILPALKRELKNL
ncbi:MAG TPA: nucleotidyl transferase AbiEii/AbiGii toxin family protein [Blastocatellia bacterium]|nr:nucleotidyl transferase AbiEii/AbiGii toxin family protein [Blastocatellia bacterium]